MENFNTNSASILSDEYSSDYVNHNAFTQSEKVKKELLKKRITMISLGAFYVLLLVVSFALLS